MKKSSKSLPNNMKNTRRNLSSREKSKNLKHGIVYCEIDAKPYSFERLEACIPVLP